MCRHKQTVCIFSIIQRRMEFLLNVWLFFVANRLRKLLLYLFVLFLFLLYVLEGYSLLAFCHCVPFDLWY